MLLYPQIRNTFKYDFRATSMKPVVLDVDIAADIPFKIYCDNYFAVVAAVYCPFKKCSD